MIAKIEYQRNKLFNTTHVGAILLFYFCVGGNLCAGPGVCKVD